ncbi:MAG TPA: acyl-CoA dehydrogenase family protein [Allosphingosinicella sp.]|jgi:alkylation response protein AidB-like acyl-CoA dehydrogenase|nr:acyl-CoA dehydrogenase family protein [Allosphingosinicella sp.]
MDLNFTAEERAFRDEVRAFLKEQLPADLARKMTERRHLEKDDIVRWQRTLNARGWATPNWPVEHGGQAWTPAQRYIFQEEMALAHAPEGSPFNVNMIGPIVCRFGTAAQKEKFLARIANLDDWWCQGFSEPGAGSDLASLKTRAERDGDFYVVNGQKIWTTQAQHADWMFALVRTDGSGKKQQGITFLLIDMKTPGITVRPIETIDGEHDANEVFFDNVRVPVENRIGEEGKGWDYAKHLLGSERSGIARIGLSKERLSQLRAQEAELAARGVLSVPERARLRRALAEVEVELRALELTQLRVVAADAHGGGAGAAASILKIKGTELQQRMTELMLDLAGPAGLAMPDAAANAAPEDGWIEAAAPFYFSMRKVSIFGGSNEIQKNIVAKAVLGL